jgi:methylenetetrahydrofolate dehydrogenase (NADP+)/methenyltetrahydrofolate cyclohydrolase
MHAICLKGTSLASQIKTTLRQSIQSTHTQGIRPPQLVMILMGESFASTVYVRNKQKACEEVGMKSQVINLPNTYSETNLLKLIEKLNRDPHVDGILVQLPLPPTITGNRILDAIDPSKDVDGFHPTNIGLLVQKRPYFRPCTPYGIIKLLDTLPITLRGLHAVVVGASNIVGKPMALELLNKDCTVTVCHIATKNLAQHIAQADLLISAIGQQGVIQSQWIKENAIVIDAGINRTADDLITGDIEFDTAAQRAYAITPVPGGVGPMTVAMLLENTWSAYQAHLKS